MLLNLLFKSSGRLHLCMVSVSFRIMPKILFHFGELSLKGKNRSTFERRMAQNIKRVLKPVLKPAGFHREHGRMTADLESISDELLDYLALIPGIRNFSVVHECELELEAMQEAAKKAVLADFGEDVAGKPVRVTGRRSNKCLLYTTDTAAALTSVECGGCCVA